MKVHIVDGVDWIGYVDWDVRDFHGYRTERGSTYNAYVIHDAKNVVVDTVKAPFADQCVQRLKAVMDPGRVDYLLCQHAEPDHSGGYPTMVAACPQAEIICNERCKAAMERHYGCAGWKFKVVKDGDSLSIGSRTLQFIDTPMAHWPESMATYVPEQKLLFSMDAFGQHFASSKRFDAEEPMDIVMAEMRTYYANILMLYGKQVGRVLDRLEGVPIETIAPSHGVVFQKHIPTAIAAYRKWSRHVPDRRVLVIYDTMWHSTERMAEAIMEGVVERGVEVRMINIKTAHITHTVTEVLDAACLAIGTPTLNMSIMPEMAATLTYLESLKPERKAGLVFGSYGWAQSGQKMATEYLKRMKVDLIQDMITCQFVPTAEVLAACREAGRQLADKATALAG